MGSAIDLYPYSESSPWHDFVRRRASHRSSGLALDIGFGLGQDSIFLAENGYKVKSLEKSSELVEKFSEREIYNVEILHESIHDFVSDLRFDVILLNRVDHFLSDNEFKEVLIKINFLAAIGSILVLTLINASEERVSLLNGALERWELIDLSLDCVCLRSDQIVRQTQIIKKLTSRSRATANAVPVL